MHCGYITTLNNVRPHPNADRLVLATCFNNTVCIAKDKYYEGQIATKEDLNNKFFSLYKMGTDNSFALSSGDFVVLPTLINPSNEGLIKMYTYPLFFSIML